MNKCLRSAAMMLLFTPAIQAWPQDSTPSPTLHLEDCRIRAGEGYPGIKARCGTLERPENPAAPNGDILELFVAVVPALSLEPDPDPLVPIAGGPGQASSEFYASTASAFEAVRRTRDIVLLDQRGTGKSAPMTCEADEALAEGRYSRAQAITQTEACLLALPHDPRYFTTSVAVQDLEALRLALGYEKFNVYGISYGSRVAQHYMRRYPESTRTVVLDGVVPPQLALGPGIAIEAQKTLDGIFSRCTESTDCGERFPNIETDFMILRSRLAVETVLVQLMNPVTGAADEIVFGNDEMAGALRLLSYHPNTVALMPLLIDQAANGNFRPLAAQAMMISEALSESINIGMHNAVVCTEDAPFFAGESVTQEALETTYIGPLQLDALSAICSVWPAGVLDDGFKEPVSSDIPVLLLSGEYDPITPPAYGDAAALEFDNFTHLTGAKQGHGQAPRGCMSNIIGDFVASADLESLETECLERLHAMPFFLDFSGPAP
ncbi:MAG: alpha/beta fold hydrolase [Woeseia sp.]|nr:alpha/beta fold hydrolase [Woeseia sp.]MBT6210134.1 alpha/beta fold hydrolase [Woeseia sp.]